MRLATLLSRSNALHQALGEAVGELEGIDSDLRLSVTMDALLLAAQHGQGLRMLLDAGLGSSAMGMLRMQYEAVLRAVWAMFAASDRHVSTMAAPLTPGTAKAAGNIGLPKDLLEAVEASQAPDDLKRSMREFRTSSWDITNSYVHAGLHALRRQEFHLEHELAIALRMSNGLALLAVGLMVIVGQHPRRQADLNVVSVSFLECKSGNSSGTQGTNIVSLVLDRRGQSVSDRRSQDRVVKKPSRGPMQRAGWRGVRCPLELQGHAWQEERSRASTSLTSSALTRRLSRSTARSTSRW